MASVAVIKSSEFSGFIKRRTEHDNMKYNEYSIVLVIIMLDAREIYPLSDFQRNAKQFIEQLQSTHKPIVLTVNGKASVVMQDAASYQELLDELELARSSAIIRQGMAEVAAGKERDALEALEESRLKHDIPR